MQATSLNHRYGQLISEVDGLPEEALAFTAPLLVDDSQEWRSSATRLLFIGQETRGWGWSENGNSLKEVAQNPDSLDLLLEAYRKFDFGRELPKLARAPFWRFFYQLETIPNWKVLWTNLAKVAVPPAMSGKGSHSFFHSQDTTRVRVLDWQRGVLLAEISEFNPTHIVFATGPYYDGLIDTALGSALFDQVRDIDYGKNQLAVVTSPQISIPMIRTYHPAFLNRRKLFSPVRDFLIEFVNGRAT